MYVFNIAWIREDYVGSCMISPEVFTLLGRKFDQEVTVTKWLHKTVVTKLHLTIWLWRDVVESLHCSFEYSNGRDELQRSARLLPIKQIYRALILASGYMKYCDVLISLHW